MNGSVNANIRYDVNSASFSKCILEIRMEITQNLMLLIAGQDPPSPRVSPLSSLYLLYIPPPEQQKY
jgi:hypothetical protein